MGHSLINGQLQRQHMSRGVASPFWQVHAGVHMVLKTLYKIAFLLFFNTYNVPWQFTGLFTIEHDIKKSF